MAEPLLSAVLFVNQRESGPIVPIVHLAGDAMDCAYVRLELLSVDPALLARLAEPGRRWRVTLAPVDETT